MSKFIESIAVYDKSFIIQKVTLKNESNLNALTLELITEFVAELKSLEANSDVRAIIITGHGKAFSAGGDIKRMQKKLGMFAGDTKEIKENYSKGIQEIPRTIESMKTPLIAMVNGAAVGAGCDLACMCDLRVGSEHSVFGETFAKLNLVSGDGGLYFLVRVVGYAKALEMSLTAALYKGQQAKDFGLLNFIYPSLALEEKTLELALKISKLGPMAIRRTKNALKNVWYASLENHLDEISSFQSECQTSSDHFEGLNSFFEKRDPNFKGK